MGAQSYMTASVNREEADKRLERDVHQPAEQAWNPDFHPPHSVSRAHRLLDLYRK